jgi:hypothetical protein
MCSKGFWLSLRLDCILIYLCDIMLSFIICVLIEQPTKMMKTDFTKHQMNKVRSSPYQQLSKFQANTMLGTMTLPGSHHRGKIITQVNQHQRQLSKLLSCHIEFTLIISQLRVMLQISHKKHQRLGKKTL